MRYFLLCMFLLFSVIGYSQTTQDSVDVVPLPDVTAATPDSTMVIAVQKVINQVSQWRKFDVADLLGFLDDRFATDADLQSVSSDAVYKYLEGSTANSTYLIRYLGTAPSVSESAGTVTVTEPAACTLDKIVLSGSVGLLDGSGDLTLIMDQDGKTHSSSEADGNYFAATVIEKSSANNLQTSLSAGYQIKHASISAGEATIIFSGLSSLGSFTIIAQ